MNLTTFCQYPSVDKQATPGVPWLAQQGILDSILRSAQLIFTVPRSEGNEAKDEDEDELSRACLGCQPSYFGPSTLGLAQVKASWKSMRLSALWPGFIFSFRVRSGFVSVSRCTCCDILFFSALCFVCTLDFLKLLQLKSASLPAASYYFRRVRHLQASRKLFNMLANFGQNCKLNK